MKADHYFVQAAGETRALETFVDIKREVLSEEDYIRNRFKGQKVVFPQEINSKDETEASSTNYKLWPDDILNILIWKNPDISGDVAVRPDGKISLPLIGEVRAAGVEITELQDLLRTKYAEFVENPQITLAPKQLNSRQIYILGRVKRDEIAPKGALVLRGKQKLLETLAGIEFMPDADIAESFISRDGFIVPVNLEKLIREGDLSQNIYLKPEDKIVIPPANKEVLVLGEVRNPGKFNLKNRTNLIAAVSTAGGLTPNADLLRAYIARDGQILPINFERLFRAGDLRQNILLKDSDFIYVPDIDDNKIYVLGEVRRPGLLKFKERMDIVEAVTLAGDFNSSAQKTNVKIIRGDLKNPEIIDINLKEILSGQPAKHIYLQRGDIVFVPRTSLAKWSILLDQLLPSLRTIQIVQDVSP